jgi:hypothetical protein
MTIAVDVDLLRQLRLALPAEALDRFSQRAERLAGHVRAAWHDAVDRWRAARDLEEQVSQEWVGVLDRLVEGAQR